MSSRREVTVRKRLLGGQGIYFPVGINRDSNCFRCGKLTHLCHLGWYYRREQQLKLRDRIRCRSNPQQNATKNENRFICDGISRNDTVRNDNWRWAREKWWLTYKTIIPYTVISIAKKRKTQEENKKQLVNFHVGNGCAHPSQTAAPATALLFSCSFLIGVYRRPQRRSAGWYTADIIANFLLLQETLHSVHGSNRSLLCFLWPLSIYVFSVLWATSSRYYYMTNLTWPSVCSCKSNKAMMDM